MAEAKVYSERLGAISDEQFAAVAERLNLGRFVSAAPTTSGLFGQNVFLTTTEGEFVLRGAPHWVRGPGERAWRREDRWQFSKETYFAEQLHLRTGAPVPWPMLHDGSDDIFGWPYLVMPRMPGQCFDERSIRKALSPDDQRGVAEALGALLAQIQQLTSPFAGDFDVDTIALTPHPGGAVEYTVDEVRRFVGFAQESGSLAEADIAWIEAAAARALAAGPRPNTYTHCDFKLNNLTLSRDAAGWRVTGLFDLHEARFADGALDIVRTACAYLDTAPALAAVFVGSYLSRAAPAPRLSEVMPLYVISDRLKFWEFLRRPENAGFLKARSFIAWTEPYLQAILALLRAGGEPV